MASQPLRRRCAERAPMRPHGPTSNAKRQDMTNPATKDGARRAPPYDLVVAGGGMVGLSLAIAVKANAPDARVLVCDPAFAGHPAPFRTLRASALAAGPRRMLERLGVWAAVSAGAQPIRRMEITDSRLADAVRPAFLDLSGEAEPGEPTAHMIFNADLVAALDARANELGVERRACVAKDAKPGPDAALVTASDGERFEARLLVAADGANSRLRALADIGTIGWDYPQAGIVATIGHERDHDGVARQHFLPAGPFAMLPLTGRRTSIVWNERRADAQVIASLDEADFLAELQPRFGHQLGALTLLDRPTSFPFALRVARRFAAPRLALIGDAAHVVHPIAGQGVNLGLRDAAELAERCVEALRLGLDPGAPHVLDAYERARRPDALAMSLGMDALNRLFSNDVAPLRALRDLGLGLVDRAPRAKSFFTRAATGLEAGPKLLRGEAF
jgi:2-octaprenyl-6-methoxyphenol hydroxylase